jgi:hypothetical protein
MELHHLIFTHLSIVSDDCATAIETNDVEPVLTDINADYGNRTLCCRSHGVLLVLAPRPAYRWRGRSTAGPSHYRTYLFNHLVGATKQRDGNGEAERLCGLEIDDKRDLSDLLDRQVGCLLALKKSRNK